MPSTPYNVDDLIEDLREMAATTASIMNEDNKPLSKVIAVPVCVPQETTEWEASEVIECYRDALREIAAGDSDAVSIAMAALEFEPPASRLLNGEKF